MIALKRGPKTTWAPKPEKAIQFKVTLRYIRPPIWRRVVLPDNCSLGHLHDVIQIAMGWFNSHMHAFRFGSVHYSSPDALGGELDMENENRALLRNVAGKVKTKFMYEYDFGDSWEHEIVVEKFLPFDPAAKHPVCLGGARACPPEDCGGFSGYMDILEALKASKKTAEQKELLEWLGGGYDPERFDADEVNRRLSG